MRKLKHKKRTLRGGFGMNTNQIKHKANALRSTTSSMMPSSNSLKNKANALRSTAIEKFYPFIDAITKLNGDTKMKLKNT